MKFFFFRHASPATFALWCILLSSGCAVAQPAAGAKYYEDALSRFEKRDYSGALVQAKNALQQDPNSLAAHLLAARASLALGKPTTAEYSLNTALQLGVDRSEAIPLLAQALFDQGKYKQLLDRIDPIGMSPRAKAETLTTRAYAQSELGDFRAATIGLEEASKLDPKSAAVSMAQAHLALRQRDATTAKRFADQAVTLAPGDARAWNMRGSVAHALGDAKAAIENYAYAIKLDAGYSEPRLARASIYLDLNRLQDASADLAQLTSASSGDPRISYLRAVLAARQADVPAVNRALGDAARSVDALPQDRLALRPQYMLIGGLAHYGLNQQEKAKSYLQRFIGANPGHLGARQLLASIYLAQRDHARVITLLEPIAQSGQADAYSLSLLASAYLASNRLQSANELLERAVQAAAVDPNLQASLGFTLLGSGRVESGLDHLRRAFQANPKNVHVGTAVAVLDLKRGQPKAAVQTAELLAKRAPRDAVVWNLLGVARAASGDRTGARAAYEKAIVYDKKLLPPQLNLAKLDAAENKLDAARKRLGEVLQENQNNGQALLELAHVELAANRPDEAIRLLEKIMAAEPRNQTAGIELVDLLIRVKRMDKALATAKDLESRLPDQVAVLAALGRAYLASGERAKARTLFDRMTRVAGFDADQQHQIARYQIAAGNPDGARYNLDKALNADPNHMGARALLVELELNKGDFAKAEQHATTVQTRFPSSSLGYRLLGDVALARGNTQGAVGFYQAAYNKQNDTENALRLSLAHQRAGQARAAIDLLNKLWRARPAEDGLGRALAEIYLSNNDLRSAKTIYLQLLQTFPNDPILHNNLAEVLRRLGDPAALQYAERAFALAPQDAMVNDTLGWILVGQARFDAGLQRLREARLRNPQDPNIRYHLAYVLSQTGRQEEARTELRAALKEYPQFESVAEARRLLEQLERR